MLSITTWILVSWNLYSSSRASEMVKEWQHYKITGKPVELVQRWWREGETVFWWKPLPGSGFLLQGSQENIWERAEPPTNSKAKTTPAEKKAIISAWFRRKSQSDCRDGTTWEEFRISCGSNRGPHRPRIWSSVWLWGTLKVFNQDNASPDLSCEKLTLPIYT